MAMTVADVLKRANYVLNDTSNVRWTLDEILLWITDAMREIGRRNPGAMSRRKVLTLVAGTRQTIADDAMRLMDAVRNINADDSPGRVLTVIDRTQLDAQDPDWHMASQTGRIRHVMYDPTSDTLGFFVYPPAKAGTKIEVIDSALLTPVTSKDDVLPVRDQYLGAIVSYVLYRSLSKESEDASGQLAAAHYSAFANSLGDATQAAAAAQTAGV